MFRAITSPAAALTPPGARQSKDTSTALCRVAFCGPIAEAGKPAGGGYEAANRRTCDALTRRGVSVIERPYPKAAGSKLSKLLRYAASFVKTGAYLLACRNRYDLLHLTPLNMHFAMAETLLVSCAKLAGRPVLIDIRAGTFVRHYECGHALYRGTIDRSLRRASEVSVEGQAYIPFVRHRTRRPVFYFPNYVDEPSLQRHANTPRPEPEALIRLIYFGRLVPEKGIETALQTVALLAERGHAVHLELIGDGPMAFVSEMRKRHAALPVTWTAGLPVDEILAHAARAHFFFFASRHDGEGHSNALNEAMSVGLVPICSEQGFTRSVVGNAGVVLPTSARAADYLGAIEGIVAKGRWARLSERARARVRTLYSEDAAVPGLIDLYRKMLLRR